MKLPASALSRLHRSWLTLVTLGLSCLLWLCVTSVPKLDNSPSIGDFKPYPSAYGQTIQFAKGAVQFTNPGDKPTGEWRDIHVPNRFLQRIKTPSEASRKTAWVRLTFNRSDVGPGALALATDFSRGRYEIFLNGTDVYRNYSAPSKTIYFWNKPIYCQFPSELLKDKNEILLKIEPTATNQQGVGILRVGPDGAMNEIYRLRFLVGTVIPESINNVILSVSLVFALIWLYRRSDLNIGLMAFVGFAWYARNLHYYVDEPPFLRDHFSEISNGFLHVLVFAVFAYAAHFMRLPHWRRYVKWVGLISIVLLIAHWVLLLTFFRTKYGLLLSSAASFAFLVPLILQYWRQPKFENLAVVSAIALTIACSLHDYGLLAFFWTGATFFLQPYSSVVMFGVFGTTLGFRVLKALDTAENLNQILDRRVSEATEELRRNEAELRDLEVNFALEKERERIMGEIHDRIGSNLGSSLAAIRRDNPESPAVPIIKRALIDLKISVDSLEPIEGDVVALLANLRHRLEPDVAAAGITFDWKITESASVPWLDTVSALHVLRILQEAISNVLQHANASIISVSNSVQVRGQRSGVLVKVSDNGLGHAAANLAKGRGIQSMKRRANAIKSNLQVQKNPAGGVEVSLWLPLCQADA